MTSPDAVLVTSSADALVAIMTAVPKRLTPIELLDGAEDGWRSPVRYALTYLSDPAHRGTEDFCKPCASLAYFLSAALVSKDVVELVLEEGGLQTVCDLLQMGAVQGDVLCADACLLLYADLYPHCSDEEERLTAVASALPACEAITKEHRAQPMIQ
ncbi:hypothetical protein KIPB_014680, partial [Kipferlia bialata]|eukprot:g14680.t1